MKNLPAPLISEILSRVPVKSLLQCRCVSKLWSSLIDDPHFINLHLNYSVHNTTNHTLMIKDCFLFNDLIDGERYLYSLDFPTLNRAIEVQNNPLTDASIETEIVGSCNGLLCLSDAKDQRMVIYNPATRKHRSVSFSPLEFPIDFVVCDKMIYGFGYDKVNDDYKVVRIIQLYEPDTDFHDNEVKIYSLKSNSWRRVRDLPNDYYLSYDMGWGVYVNGCLHWAVTQNPRSHRSKLIFAFDLETEEYKIVPQPEYSPGNFLINVGVLGECLRVLAIYLKSRTDVWIMKEYGVKESWTKLFSVPLDGVFGFYEGLRPIAYSKDGSNVLVQIDFKKLFWYDLRRQKVKRVQVYGIPESFEAELLVESLISLDSPKKKKKKKPKKSRNKLAGQTSRQIATLPMTLVSSILCRLPTKTLLQLRCVCKAWYNLTYDPSFVKVHLEVTGKNNGNLNVIIREEKLHMIDFSQLNKAVQVNHPLTCYEGWTDILGSYDGLLCIYNPDKYIAVWNPLTGSCHKLPSSELRSLKDFGVYGCFIHGFGYDPIMGDYKVVRIMQQYNSFASDVHVYSLKNKYWRRMDQGFPYKLVYPCSGVFANGALHWVAHQRHELDSTSYIIMAFDLGLELCLELPQPNYEDINFHMILWLLGGSLCVLCHYPRHGVDIWVLKDYEMRSWQKLISITQPKQIKFFEYIKPLAYSKNGNEVLMELDYENLIWYDLKKKTIRHVNNISKLPKSVEAEVFYGSLIDPNNISGYSDVSQGVSNGSNGLQSVNQRKPLMVREKKGPAGQSKCSLALFPKKLLSQILSELPVKTLVQAQLVCKTWYNLINDPELIKMQLEVSNKSSHENLSIILRGEKLFSVDFKMLDKAIEIRHPLFSSDGFTNTVGSSNGLVCLNKDKDFALWNPWTGKYERLPRTSFKLVHASDYDLHWFHGFGYDSIGDDYKVVCILQQHSRLKGGSIMSQLQVYSLKKKCWGPIQSFPYMICPLSVGIFANGALHWVVRQIPDLFSSSNLIIAIDLGADKCRVVTQPSYVDTDFHMSLGVLGGSLCLLCHYPKESVDLWIMTDCRREIWTKLASIFQPNTIKKFEYLKPLAYSKEGTDVLLEQDNEKLLWYNLRKKTVRYVDVDCLPWFFETLMCSSSLVQTSATTKFFSVIHEQPPKKGSQSKKNSKRDDMDDFLSKGFNLKL